MEWALFTVLALGGAGALALAIGLDERLAERQIRRMCYGKMTETEYLTQVRRSALMERMEATNTNKPNQDFAWNGTTLDMRIELAGALECEDRAIRIAARKAARHLIYAERALASNDFEGMTLHLGLANDELPMPS